MKDSKSIETELEKKRDELHKTMRDFNRVEEEKKHAELKLADMKRYLRKLEVEIGNLEEELEIARDREDAEKEKE